MSLKTLVYLRINIFTLQGDQMMLRGFNGHGEQALASIVLPLEIGDWKTEAKFYIIDSNTSFITLLSQP